MAKQEMAPNESNQPNERSVGDIFREEMEKKTIEEVESFEDLEAHINQLGDAFYDEVWSETRHVNENPEEGRKELQEHIAMVREDIKKAIAQSNVNNENITEYIVEKVIRAFRIYKAPYRNKITYLLTKEAQSFLEKK